MSVVKVLKEACTMFTSMTPPERAASGGLTGSVGIANAWWLTVVGQICANLFGPVVFVLQTRLPWRTACSRTK